MCFPPGYSSTDHIDTESFQVGEFYQTKLLKTRIVKCRVINSISKIMCYMALGSLL